MKTLFSVLVIIVCTILLQAHSIPFWIEFTGLGMGILWSVSIEGTLIWSWLNRFNKTAIVLSAVVILIPLWQLGKPIMKEMRVTEIDKEITILNNTDIEMSKNLQKKILKTNWAGTINKNTAHFREAIKSQKEHLIQKANRKNHIESIGILVLQGVAILMIFIVQINTIREMQFRKTKRVETEKFDNIEIIETPESRAKIILSKIEILMQDKQIKQQDVAILIEAKGSDISKLKRTASGKQDGVGIEKIIRFEKNIKILEQGGIDV